MCSIYFFYLGSLWVRLQSKLLPPQDAALANSTHSGPGKAEMKRRAPVYRDAATSTRSPAQPDPLPKGVSCFLASFHGVLFGCAEVRNTTQSSFHFSRTFIHILVSSYLLPLDFYWGEKKKSPYCRQKEIMALKGAMSNAIKITIPCALHVVHLFFCHSSFHDCLLSCSYCLKKHFMPYLHVFI